MKRFFAVGMMISALVVVSYVFTGDARTTRTPTTDKFFIGLWEAVDPLDGTSVRISLSDHDGDGVFQFVQGDSFWVACSEEGEMGRGSVLGTATINEEGQIVAMATLTCTFSRRVVAEGSFPFEANREDDLLVAMPEGVPGGVAFYRISTSRNSN